MTVVADRRFRWSGRLRAAALARGRTKRRGASPGPAGRRKPRQGLRSINEAGGARRGWELDLFGKIKREVEAQTADAEALKDARDWVFVTVAADVARAYLDMRAQQRQLGRSRREYRRGAQQSGPRAVALQPRAHQ